MSEAPETMVRITGSPRRYDWGSLDRLPDFLGAEPDGRPLAEVWFGVHPEGPASLASGDDVDDRRTLLSDHIVSDPMRTLGPDVVGRYGEQLPYLLKLIAPDRALSLQVHPDLDRARDGYLAEEAAGIPRGAFERNYPDSNHKPELVYALETFEAVCGFRAPRRALEVIADLDCEVTDAMAESLRGDPSANGVRAVVENLLGADTRPTPDQVAAVAEACARRLESGRSPSPRIDRIVGKLANEHPGDPGIVVVLLLNPVTLQPGEAMFAPAGTVHAYLSGLAVEIMASSDNVLRAGLTSKHIDVPEVLETLDYVAAPPVRIAPEHVSEAVAVFYAPVDDFELAVVTPAAAGEDGALVPGRGPRVLLAIEGEVPVRIDGTTSTLARGEAAFVSGECGPVTAYGDGRFVQADVP
jgi:mannose-6-phosphate isomerase